jgi:signal transduction histidine kinase
MSHLPIRLDPRPTTTPGHPEEADTKVRTRLILAFAYVLITVMLALGVPLAVNLQRRAVAELETQAVVQAQSIASFVGGENIRPDKRDELGAIVAELADQIPGRVIVVDADGTLAADSSGPVIPGTDYATPSRPEIVTALAGTPSSEIRFSDTLGRDIMATAVPIRDEGPDDRPVVRGAVRITQTIDQVRANVRRVTFGLFAIGLAGLTAGLLLAFLLANSLARPLGRLADHARRLGHGDLSARAENVGGAREIATLARSFDEMAERVERSVRAQREFVANASHQLRTPLTGMKLRLEAASADAPERVRRSLEAAEREVDRMADIVDRLLVMARQIERGEPVPLDLSEAAARAVARWRDRAVARGASLQAEGEPVSARVDGTDLDQMLDNLIDNAISYAAGPVEVRAGRADGAPFLDVRDHGPGIPAEDLPRVVERFYRGRGAPRGGSGLGLAIVRELAERSGGRVRVEAPADGGTRVRLSFPDVTSGPRTS